ncbi:MULTISPECIES: 3-(methylthio)propionyl-CoA ligase [Hydrocarboniphaga]|jgi:acyl-CoA synthetase (AMP-forming)/AMP-acid ligase II|uniref:Long-chain-fatty-acid--CoA ligase n=1 Tax=Hydrocarboniphaga effusa AP103 TaxID=1172194 RepID=I8TB98_9GAMM|nr:MULTISPECIES: 3-(methylthio)propionyl-CoA ligase [Hydrocarboniphaga]EIT71065.1 long-chain-fatty-acid--CoA ligase [Hydrocarboniphaga effusa AP103]MDZ4079572.1 3-(methylthio)propionyl-CoA ligase [Hydrocarboniphaga sp.]
MNAQMMQMPLLVSSIMTHAARYHGDTEIVSQTVEGAVHRYTYAEASRRTQALANVLARLDIGPGDRVGTLAWNGFRHLELYYAVSGIGAVVHTLNPRLFSEQIAWIVNHARDTVVFFDLSFLSLVEAVAPQCPSVRHWIVMTDKAHMPADSSGKFLCYEDLMSAEPQHYDWPDLPETMASGLCYTSGTTGNPKGVLYSHRSTVLHALACIQPDVMNLSARDVVLPAVPMFHVNAWGLPYSALMVGAKLVLPGPNLDGASLHRLCDDEGVTLSAGVPTVWLGFRQHLQKIQSKPSTLKRVLVGGSACPPSLMQAFDDEYGVSILHLWGMTELSPVGTVNTLKLKHQDLPDAQRHDLLAKQGRPPFGIELKIVNDAGESLPTDGQAAGDLLVRGHWVLDRYYESDHSPLREGWFPTGDVANIDADGYLLITDRSKDIIKSGGEWISSIELENIAMSHPAIAEAAAIGVRHPKWDERPLIVAVKKPGADATREDILAHYAGKIAKWSVPDDVVFVDELPHTATGKLSKLQLRQKLSEYRLPDSR